MAMAGSRGSGMLGRIASSAGGNGMLSMLEAGGADMGALELGALGGPLGIAAVLAYKIGKGIVRAPFELRDKFMEAQAPAAEYMSLRSRYAALGRVGNVDSRGVEGAFSGGDAGLASIGVGPSEGAAILGRYGVAQRSAGTSVDVVRAIASQQYAGSLSGLGTDRYAASANFAQNAGFTLPGLGQSTDQASGLQRYFKKLESVTSVAVAAGMDRSVAVSNVENLLRAGAMSGAAGLGSGKGVADQYARMIQGGTAPDRMGVTAGDMLQGSLSLPDKIGFSGDALHMGVMGSAIQNLGGTKAFLDPADSALIRIIGKDSYNSFVQSTTGAKLISNLHDAAKTGNGVAVQNALAPLIKGNSQADLYIAKHSYLNSIGGYYGQVALGNFLGVNQTSLASQEATAGLPTSAGSASGTRGVKNNNPLNLSYLPGQGAVGSDGRFGRYATMEQGISADTRQLMLYQDRDKLSSIRQLVSKWAPSSDGNDVASYVAQVSQQMGISPDAPLDLHNAAVAQSLVTAMAKRESGVNLDPATVKRGVQMAYGQPVQPLANGPYASIAEGNNVSGQNTANTRVDQLKRDTGSLSADYFTQMAGGAIGKTATDTSRAVTKFDSSAIGSIGDTLNSMVSAITGSTSGLV